MPWLTACRACHQTCCRPSTSITFGGDRLGEHCSTGSAMLWGDDNEEGLKVRSVGTVWIIRGACLKVLRSKAGGQNSDPEVEEWESCLMLFPISQMFCKGYRWLLQHGFIEHCGCFTMMSIARVHLSCPYLCISYMFWKICFTMLHWHAQWAHFCEPPNLHASSIQNPDAAKIIDHAELDCSVLKITHFVGP